MPDVVDDVGQVGVVEGVGVRADRNEGKLFGERQLECAFAEQLRHQPHRETRDELGDDLELGGGVVVPAARRRDAGQRAGAAAALQLERHPAAERVADDVCGVPAHGVHPTLDVVGQRPRVQEERAGRPAVVTRHGRCEHLVATRLSYLRCNVFPDVLRHHEGM